YGEGGAGGESDVGLHDLPFLFTDVDEQVAGRSEPAHSVDGSGSESGRWAVPRVMMSNVASMRAVRASIRPSASPRWRSAASSNSTRRAFSATRWLVTPTCQKA